MFQRFTDRARRVVVLAQEESRRLSHAYIGTEHILLGLLAEEEGIGARALIAAGAELDNLRQAVKDVIGIGTGDVPHHIPFTPRAKKILELSLRESIGLGHNYIGTEHILLGLIREREGVACQVLEQRGVDLHRLRTEVANLLGLDQTKTTSPAQPPPRRVRSSSCKHPDDALQTRSMEGMRTVRCDACGTLIGVLPAS